MPQRLFVKILWLFGIAILAQSPCASSLRAQSNDHLNVVFMLADDLGWGEVGCYGQTKIPTPHIDALAARGMRFTQHYSGAPVCAPSRCVLLSGKHLGHAEIRGNLPAARLNPRFTEGQHPISDQVLTIAEVFQNNGYATGAMGKWGLGPVDSTGEPNAQGFDYFFGYNCQSIAHSYYPEYLWRNRDKVFINAKPVPGHHGQPDGPVLMEDWIGETYAPNLMIEEAERFIDDHHEEPFFLYLPFIEPHVAIHPPQSLVEQFPEEWDTEVYRGANGYLPHPRPRAGYAAMIANVDAQVGRIMARLEHYSLDENTLVVFTSDNGATHARSADPRFHVGGVDADFFNSTAGLRGYKGSVYEGGLRVPMIARLPGVIPEGTVSDSAGYFADWFPTLCEAIGVAPPAGLDGESLWPVMQGSQRDERRTPMVWVFPEYGGQVAIRLGDMKVVRQKLRTEQPGDWEVYDVVADIGETNNIAQSHPHVVDRAKEVLHREVSKNKVFPLPIPGIEL